MTILVRCSDPRISHFFKQKKYAELFGLVEADAPIAVTGSIKFFLTKGMDLLWEQLEILVGHFHPDRIVLTNHTDCGYYKKLGQDDVKYYQSDLDRVKKAIEKKYPDLRVDTYIIDTEKQELLDTSKALVNA